MAIAKIPLSGSIHGRGIKVVATAIGSTPTTIHTANAVSTDGLGDDVTLYCFNSDTVSRTLTLGFGGTTAPDDLIKAVIPAGEYDLVVPGLLLRNALVIAAAADAANVLIVTGYVLRST